jgi:hypothetical protein
MGWQDSFQPIAASGASGGWQSSFQPNTYAQNVGQDFSNATNKIGEIWANKELNPASAGVQILGTAASGAYAPAGEALRSGYNSLPDSVTQPINNAASSGVNAVKGAYSDQVSKLADTSIGQKMGDYLMNSPHIQNGMQEVSDDAKSLANILTMAKVKPALGDASTIVGDALYGSGKAEKVAANQSYIEKLVREKETPSVLAENAKRTIQVDGKNIYQPTSEEIQMAKTVSDIPGVGNSLTPQGNLSAIVTERTKEAESLQNTLQKSGAKVDFGNWQKNIDQAVQNTTDNPTIVGEGKEVHQSVINAMNKAVLNNMNQNGEITAAGLLQARKDFDQALPARTFNGSNADTALGTTAKEMRRAMNKTIADSAPSADVLESLKKQSTLYDAADNIAPKAAGEAATPFRRAMQSIAPHNLTQAVGGAGMGAAALAAAHYVPISPAMVGAALVPAAAYKAATSPSTRMLLGKALGGGQ